MLYNSGRQLLSNRAQLVQLGMTINSSPQSVDIGSPQKATYLPISIKLMPFICHYTREQSWSLCPRALSSQGGGTCSSLGRLTAGVSNP